MLLKTPAATREAKALEMRLPPKRIAFRRVSSFRVYHCKFCQLSFHYSTAEGRRTLDKIRRAPGKKAASTKPSMNRVATIPPKLVVTPEQVEIIPHMIMAPPMYQLGREIRFILEKDDVSCEMRIDNSDRLHHVTWNLHQDITDVELETTVSTLPASELQRDTQ